MNALIAKCFDANALIDNLAYSLEFHYLNNIAEIVHLNVAHEMPRWADEVSEEMLRLSARPVRLDIGGYEDDFVDLKVIFSSLHEVFLGLSDFVRKLIEDADMTGDDEVRIFGENFLMEVSVFVKQTEEWLRASEALDAQSLNIHIKDYTHSLKIK